MPGHTNSLIRVESALEEETVREEEVAIWSGGAESLLGWAAQLLEQAEGIVRKAVV